MLRLDIPAHPLPLQCGLLVGWQVSGVLVAQAGCILQSLDDALAEKVSGL